MRTALIFLHKEILDFAERWVVKLQSRGVSRECCRPCPQFIPRIAGLPCRLMNRSYRLEICEISRYYEMGHHGAGGGEGWNKRMPTIPPSIPCVVRPSTPVTREKLFLHFGACPSVGVTASRRDGRQHSKPSGVA